MKLAAVFLLVLTINVSAEGNSQEITLKLTNTSLEKVFHEIRKQSGYVFFYKTDLLKDLPGIDLKVKNASIDETMRACLSSVPLTYAIIDKTIVVSFRQDKAEEKSTEELSVPEIEITGRVTTDSGLPLSGASVRLKGSNTGTTTDANGRFSLRLPDTGGILEVSFVGYNVYEISVNKSGNFNINLKQKDASIDEVVVIGYGSVKKSDLTGAVASINNDDVTRTPTGNLILALQGQVAGVNIQQNTGTPGGASKITIRGANSLATGRNAPLYVIDGLILTDIGTNIELEDVQSVQILKDASATAIYGSRGANGVILITTKRGVVGKVQINYDSYFGVQTLIKELDFLSSTQYKDYYLKSRQNATTATTIDSTILNSPYNTNWADEVYRNALIQNHTISVRGGTTVSKYYTSINYFNQQGIISNTDFTRLSLRFNGDQQLSEKLLLSNNILLSYTKSNGVLGDEVVSNGIAWARPTTPILDVNGRPTMVTLPFARTNPRSLIDNVTNENLNYRLVGNIVLEYKISKKLMAKFNIGTDFSLSNLNSYIPKTLTESSFQGTGNKNNSIIGSWISENTLNYNTTINKDHSISSIGGVTFQDTRSNVLGGTSRGFIIDGFEFNNLGAGTTQNTTSSYSRSTILSYLGRVNYAYRDKYLLTISGRYDGSSRLSEDHKYALFPSVAVAWKLSEENFLNSSTWLSELKIRASWGKTGSQSVSPYSSFSRLSNTTVYLDGSNNGSIGFIPSAVANADLEWEKTSQTDIGFDAAFLNNRIQVTVDYYNKNTKGLLLDRQTPPSSGYTSSTQNVGEVENKGFELFVKSQNVRRLLEWNTILNFSLNRSKVVDLGKSPDGQPVKMINTSEGVGWFPVILGEVPYTPFGYFVQSIDKSTGKYIFKDIDNNGSIDANDRGIIGNFQPKYIFGLINDFVLKNFDLSVFLQGSVGNDVFIDAFRHSLNLNGNNNILKTVYEGAGTKYPIANADYGNSGGSSQNSTALIFDGTYIRFKNITIGYTFRNIFGKGKAGSIRVYVTGNNLLTIDKNYPWYDPEVSAGSDVITGWDRGGYANNKSVIGGLKISF